MVHEAALTRIRAAGMDRLGRLPAHYQAAKALKERAWTDGAVGEDVGP